MKKISDVKVGDTLNNLFKGTGVVVKVTKRTITVKYPLSTCKNSYFHSDAEFFETDF
jgi:hypothetical protein